MKTVILCGGKGHRLKEETDFKPKPMITIGGKPMLWHIMKIYEHAGFNEFIIALGYKGDDVKQYFLNHIYFQHDFTLETKTGEKILHKTRDKKTGVDDFKITFVDTGAETLTGERVRRLKRYVENETFMLTYGDGLINADISDIVKFHRQKKCMGTITGVKPHSKWGLVRKNKKNIVTLFQQKPKLNEYINGGFMVFEPELFDYLKPNEMIEVSFERLAKKRKLSIYPYEGFWHAMDTYQDLEELNNLWRKKPEWKIW